LSATKALNREGNKKWFIFYHILTPKNRYDAEFCCSKFFSLIWVETFEDDLLLAITVYRTKIYEPEIVYHNFTVLLSFKNIRSETTASKKEDGKVTLNDVNSELLLLLKIALSLLGKYAAPN
jgi:hypothetical protein